jgi:uncharacterized protein (DUF4415 family)
MPKLKSGTVVPSVAEDAAINAGIAADPDTYEMSDDEWRAASRVRKMGRPKSDVTKERITIRLSPDVLEQFRATGPGWQTRIDTVLKEWLATH